MLATDLLAAVLVLNATISLLGARCDVLGGGRGGGEGGWPGHDDDDDDDDSEPPQRRLLSMNPAYSIYHMIAPQQWVAARMATVTGAELQRAHTTGAWVGSGGLMYGLRWVGSM